MLSYHHLGLSPFDATTPIRSMSSVDCMSASEFPCHLLSCSEVVRPSSVFGHGEQATISYCPTLPARAIAVTGINKMTMTAEHLFFVSPKPKKTKDQRPKTKDPKQESKGATGTCATKNKPKRELREEHEVKPRFSTHHCRSHTSRHLLCAIALSINLGLYPPTPQSFDPRPKNSLSEL